MSLPIIGSTPGAQSSNQSIAATADGNGNITFVGPSGIQGSTITCVTTVPNAPAGASFVARLGGPTGLGVALQTWLGGSTAGRFQVGVGQTIVVKGSGLVPGVQYTCTFAAIIDVGDVQVIIPEPNSSITGTAPNVVSFSFFASGGAGQTFTVPANVGSINVDMAGAQGGNSGGGVGGKGARIQCTIATIPGQVLTINVGKQAVGGVAGTGQIPGGAGANGVQASGAGGGGSSGLSNAGGLLAHAGGGGGAANAVATGNVANGGGGGASGVTGGSFDASALGGVGATPLAAGAGGVGNEGNGTAGSNVAGGAGGTASQEAAGGGGGGVFGGGGGGVGFVNPNFTTSGGGGGSSVVAASVTATIITPSFESGDGYVTLSYVVL